MKIDNLYIEITNRCNLNCLDCYNASGCNTETRELPPEVIYNFINLLHEKYELISVDISGGEPLLHSRFDKLLLLLEQYPFCSYLIITNGTLRNEYLYNLLSKNKCFTLQFSIDGIDEETHSKNRGPGTFVKTINNLKSLSPINTPFIKTVVSKYNINRIEDFFLLAKENNCIPSFSFCESLGNAKKNCENFILSHFDKIRVVKKIEQLSEKYNVNVKPPYAPFHCPLLKEDSPIGLCVKPDGNIQPCQNLYDDCFSIGNIYNPDFDKMQKSLSQLRKILIERLNMDYGCSECINRTLCTKGCPAHAFNNNGSILSADGSCDYRKLQTALLASSTLE